MTAPRPTPHPAKPRFSTNTESSDFISDNHVARHNRVLPPLFEIEVMLLARKSSGPFSCRMYGKAMKYTKTVTILGVIMGTPSEDPLLRSTSTEKYMNQLIERETL